MVESQLQSADDFRILVDAMVSYGKMLVENPRMGERRNSTGELVCYYCGSSMQEPGEKHRDHLFPQKLQGSSEDWNLVWCCRACNINKRAKFPVFWIVESRPEMPPGIWFDFLSRVLVGLIYYQESFLGLIDSIDLVKEKYYKLAESSIGYVSEVLNSEN